MCCIVFCLQSYKKFELGIQKCHSLSQNLHPTRPHTETIKVEQCQNEKNHSF